MSPLIIVATSLFHHGPFGSVQAAQLADLLRCDVLCKYQQSLYQQRAASTQASLQQGHVKWILGLLCLQQVTYCCAGLSAALEKPLKQDNLSAPRHCSARTKRWDKGAVWLGIGSYWTYSDTHKSRCCLPVCRPALIPVKTTKIFNFAISFFPPFNLHSYLSCPVVPESFVPCRVQLLLSLGTIAFVHKTIGCPGYEVRQLGQSGKRALIVLLLTTRCVLPESKQQGN